MSRDIKDSESYKDKIFPAALRELQTDQEPPTGEQQLEAICSIIDRYALPKELESFLVAMVAFWLARAMKAEGLTIEKIIDETTKSH